MRKDNNNSKIEGIIVTIRSRNQREAVNWLKTIVMTFMLVIAKKVYRTETMI